MCIVIYLKNHDAYFVFFTFLAIGNQTFILHKKHYFDLTIFIIICFPVFFSQLLYFQFCDINFFFPQKYLRFSGGLLLIDYGLGDDLLFWFGVFAFEMG